MQIIQLPVLQDNYAYIVIADDARHCVFIDTPDAKVLIDYVQKHQLQPVAILNTHHHWDHAGGNLEICQKYNVRVYTSVFDFDRIEGATDTVKDGDVVDVGGMKFQVLDVPGHTSGHVAYLIDQHLFCGDTIFVGGCGRLFEGTPQQMFTSINKIAELPDSTWIHCTHEYTQKNLEFALTLEPNNLDLKNKLDKVRLCVQRSEATVPTQLGDERKYNPYLRWAQNSLQSGLKSRGFEDFSEDWKIFAEVRRLKDHYA